MERPPGPGGAALALQAVLLQPLVGSSADDENTLCSATRPAPFCHLGPETPPQAVGVCLQIPGPVTTETSGGTCFLFRQPTGGLVPSKILMTGL